MKRILLLLSVLTTPLIGQWSNAQHHDSIVPAGGGVRKNGFTSNVTTGHLLVFLYEAPGDVTTSDTATAMANTVSATCASAGSAFWTAGSGRGLGGIWYCVANATGVDTMTATTTGGGSWDTSVQEFSGNAAASLVDAGANDTTAFTTSWSSSPFTMGTTGDLVIGVTMDFASGGNTTISAGTGYTILGQLSQGTGNAFATEYKTGTAIADSTTFTATANAFWIAQGSSFKPAAGGGGGHGWIRH